MLSDTLAVLLVSPSKSSYAKYPSLLPDLFVPAVAEETDRYHDASLKDQFLLNPFKISHEARTAAERDYSAFDMYSLLNPFCVTAWLKPFLQCQFSKKRMKEQSFKLVINLVIAKVSKFRLPLLSLQNFKTLAPAYDLPSNAFGV